MGVARAHNLLTGLLYDLQARSEYLQSLLEPKVEIKEVEKSVQEIRTKLVQLKAQIVNLRASDRIHEPVLFREAYDEYQDLYREVAIIEQFAIPVLLRFDKRDQYASNLIRLIIDELGLHINLMPLVSTTSSQYYWAKPEVGIIAMPAGDLRGLLGWPDLFHELSHILLSLWPDFLIAFSPIVKNHFRKKRQQIADISGGELDNKWLLQAQMKWNQREEGTWQIEMAANLMATYMVGPSFGWQHIRLFTNHSNMPYSPAPGESLTEHPADQAQMDGILAMLTLLGCEKQRGEIEEQWQSILSISGKNVVPQGYDLYYPAPIIEGIAEVVFSACKKHGLTSFIDQAPHTIVKRIDEAWRLFTDTPQLYPDWESTKFLEIDALIQD